MRESAHLPFFDEVSIAKRVESSFSHEERGFVEFFGWIRQGFDPLDLSYKFRLKPSKSSRCSIFLEDSYHHKEIYYNRIFPTEVSPLSISSTVCLSAQATPSESEVETAGLHTERREEKRQEKKRKKKKSKREGEGESLGREGPLGFGECASRH